MLKPIVSGRENDCPRKRSGKKLAKARMIADFPGEILSRPINISILIRSGVGNKLWFRSGSMNQEKVPMVYMIWLEMFGNGSRIGMMLCITSGALGSILRAPKREYGKCSAVLAGRLKRPKFGSLPAWPAIRLTVIIPLVFDAPPMAPHLEILFSLGSSQIGQENFVYSPYP